MNRRRKRRKPRTRAHHLAVLVVAAVTGLYAAPRVARMSLADVPAQLAHMPDAVAALPARMVTQVTDGRHLGFDTHSYPGDRAMRAWRTAAPYEWVGYYLPGAPCHQSTSWAGKRQTLAEMGWGKAVIYVGQQTWDGLPQPSRAEIADARRSGGLTCHRSLLSASRGEAEAEDAIATTEAEGFAYGTVIFLDVEYMRQTPEAMRDYYRAWVRTVIADSRYRPGIYVHTRNARMVYQDVRAEFEAAGVREEPPFWVAGGGRFTPGKAPRDVGHSFAAAWQGLLDVTQTWGGVRLPIDVNVAAMPSPSSPGYALAPGYANTE